MPRGARLVESGDARLVRRVPDERRIALRLLRDLQHGGDEFVVLLSEVTRKEDAAVSAEKILTALRIPHRVLETDLQITASVGNSVFPDNGTDADTLIRNADTALLHAKTSGRDRHAFF